MKRRRWYNRNIRNITLRRKTLERDRGKCVLCGEPASEVHHIMGVPNGEPKSIDNVISLCKKCHDAITHPAIGRGIWRIKIKKIYRRYKQEHLRKRVQHLRKHGVSLEPFIRSLPFHDAWWLVEQGLVPPKLIGIAGGIVPSLYQFFDHVRKKGWELRKETIGHHGYGVYVLEKNGEKVVLKERAGLGTNVIIKDVERLTEASRVCGPPIYFPEPPISKRATSFLLAHAKDIVTYIKSERGTRPPTLYRISKLNSTVAFELEQFMKQHGVEIKEITDPSEPPAIFQRLYSSTLRPAPPYIRFSLSG